jgi:hypothetical protein
MPPPPQPHLHLVGPDGASPPHRQVPVRSEPVVTIDCEDCIRYQGDDCDDCVVSYLVDHDPATPVVFGPQEQKAVDLLADAGLIPRLKFESSHGVA